jgi:hypothetical protein
MDSSGRKVAGQKDDLRELVEHFNVSIFSITMQLVLSVFYDASYDMVHRYVRYNGHGLTIWVNL